MQLHNRIIVEPSGKTAAATVSPVTAAEKESVLTKCIYCPTTTFLAVPSEYLIMFTPRTGASRRFPSRV